MAWIEQDPNAEIPYIPRFDRKSEKPLTLHIKYMNYVTHNEYMEALGREKADKTMEVELLQIQKKHDKNMFLKHVVRIENAEKADGKPMSVEEFYNNIDVLTYREIIAAISNYSTLTESQRKN